MQHTLFYDNYVFLNIQYKHYHYTDNRKGAPMNYLAYMIKGTAKIVTKNKTLNINTGDVFYIPKNISYQSYWYGDDEIEFLSFGFQNLNTNENSNCALQIVHCNEKIKEKIMSIPTNRVKVDCRTLSRFYDVMDIIIPNLEYSFDNNKEIIIEKIKDSIQKQPHCSLSEIARKCAISEPYLYALFKKNTALTPNDYRQKILCEKGIDLLITTDKKIEEIADILNFSSGSYFRKVLKKHTGSTPREIRKNSGL